MNNYFLFQVNFISLLIFFFNFLKLNFFFTFIIKLVVLAISTVEFIDQIFIVNLIEILHSITIITF